MSAAAVLALDAGNTRVKWGLRGGDDWAARGSIPTAEAARLGRDWPELPPGTLALGSNVGGPALLDYNLGIAYKEMGLIDDAIREFQRSRKDPKKFVKSSNMLGICYIEKNLYPLAIEVFKDAIEKMEDRGESYWAMHYDLAGSYEKNGNIKEALDIYTQIYGWNSKFRAVSDKIDQLKISVIESTEQKKPKERKDRVSYL